MDDLISRQAAIKLAIDLDCESRGIIKESKCREIENRYNMIPSVQPTLYGYNIQHLDLIARVLQKENLPPERITEALTDIGRDIGRIVAIVRDEFEETLRKSVEQGWCGADMRGDEQE